MKLRPGRIVAVTIVAGWAGVMATHVWQTHARSASAERLELSSPVGAALTQRGVFYRGVRIGFVREKLTPLKEGSRAEQEGQFTLNVLGRKRRMDIAGAAVLGHGGRLESFSFCLTTASGRSPFETKVTGKVDGETLELTIHSAGRKRTEHRTLSEPIVLPLNLYHSLASQGLEAGKTYRLRLFDPLTLTDGEAQITIMEPEVVHWGGREDKAFRLRTQFAGMTTTAWITETGEVLKEETPLGWTMVKEIPGSGLGSRAEEMIPEIVSASAIPAIGYAGPFDGLKRVRLRLNKFPPLWDSVDGGRQKVSGKEVVIEVEKLPILPTGSTSLTSEQRRSALDSDAFIQSDDPEIRALAARLTEGLSPLDSTRALSGWVYENVRKTPTLSIPSALEVLEQRAGDCNEHTVLFTALARAAGIPCRMATGLAWSTGQFYYHAWSEVWIGNWIAVDPTFGQFPADALHLRLLTGGLETQFEVLKLLGRGATIEILEAE